MRRRREETPRSRCCRTRRSSVAMKAAVPTKRVAAPTSSRARVSGTYYNADLDMTVTLVVREGALAMQRPKAEEIRFAPLTGDLYTNPDQMLLLVLRDESDT